MADCTGVIQYMYPMEHDPFGLRGGSGAWDIGAEQAIGLKKDYGTKHWGRAAASLFSFFCPDTALYCFNLWTKNLSVDLEDVTMQRV